MKKNVLTFSLITAIALASPLTGMAAKKKATADASPTPDASATPAASASPKADRPITYWGKVAVVDSTAKSFTLAIKKGTGRTIKVTDETTITKSDKPATFADIVKDEDVRGSYWKKADGSLEAKSVKLGPKTADSDKTKKK